VYPHNVEIFGTHVSIWNTVFAVAIVCGWIVLRLLLRRDRSLTFALPRYLLVVYLSALSAQIFAYAFDANTSLSPPPGVSAAAYFLNPVAGPKTLYGVIVLMPVFVALAMVRSGYRLATALDLWTTPMLVVLATARVGCFLQGCCYGMRSDFLGVEFPAGSPVYYQQLNDGLVGAGALASMAVVPTQAIEAVFLAALAAWSWIASRHENAFGLFVPTVAAYSVFRFLVEFARADIERGFLGHLATSQWIALAVLTTILLGQFARRRIAAVA
jgi:phosphatidylglycerol---prolipoprotein diacylglyceryl transferase